MSRSYRLVSPALGIAVVMSLVLSACSERLPTPPPTFSATKAAGSGPTVTSAAPDSAPQDTTLDVHVLGAGFDRGSKAQWAQNDTLSPNVNTNSTKFVSSTELIANITISNAASAGSYDVLVTTSTGKKGIGSDLFTITTRPVTSVIVAPSSATMAVTSTLLFTATTYDVAKKVLTGRAISWTSSAPGVATVSQAGLVTAVSSGTATITATSETVSGTAALSVVAIPSGNLVFTSLNTGSKHTCGLVSGGAAYCWGYNYDGQLGNGTSTTSPEIPTPLPGTVAGNLNFVLLSPGFSATCGLVGSGSAFCWGGNVAGLFGNGTGTNSLTPVPAASGLSLTTLTEGDEHSCGLTANGSAFCWGWNRYGQVGNGTTIDSPEPIAVSGGLTFTTISTSGPSDHTCGITTAGALYCWGLNGSGQIGAATTDLCTLAGSSGPHKATVSCALTPTLVSGGLTFSQVTTGGTHSCGIANSGSAYCWGDNTYGELGDGTTTSRQTPVAVAGGLSFSTVSAGTQFSCGLTTGGAAYCWGHNDYGQVGDGTATARAMPVPVLGGRTFVSLHAGVRFVCGLTGSGTLYCWGSNLDGQLGNGTVTDSYSPVKVGYQP